MRLPDLWDQLEPGVRIAFAKVILARQSTDDPSHREEARAAELALRARFIEQQGELLNAYYCRHCVAGCALTEGPGGSRALHTVLNRADTHLVVMETTCGTLAMQAMSALGSRSSTRPDLRMATDVVYAAMTRVLRAADEAAAGSPDADALAGTAGNQVTEAKHYVSKLVEREGGFTYFQGVLAGALITCGLATVLGLLTANLWPEVVSPAGLVGSLVFGALGAVTSVFQRISADGVALTFTPSRLRLICLGAVRPLVGATFGVVAYLGLVAGILGSTTATAGPTMAFGLAAITGFAAGFSERLATDVVQRAEAIGAVSTVRDPAAGG
ncbi:hypothetical protein MB27_10330 [Actinoplanes utahensis]|uniref:Uncharacterized protein n=1 Tax=Actinoplanes utahensis TaxID=1869 RepID=A0A0A6UR36_ACTUT|nr:hypothetical protein MB27_10330 [Actinoplanes utahensis]